MVKRATLKLDGDLTGGLRVELTIGEIGGELYGGEEATLPPAPQVNDCSKLHWDQNYRAIAEESTRSLLLEMNLDTPAVQLDNETEPAIEPDSVRAIRPKALRKKHDLKQVCDESAQTLSTQFQTWLESSPTFQTLTTAAVKQLPNDEPFQFVIQHSDPEVLRLPWQDWLLFNHYCKQSDPTFSRLSKTWKRSEVPRSQGDQVRILVILGNCKNLDTEKDRQFLKTIGAETGSYILFLDAPSRQEVNNQLWEQPWDIIFFAGHSTSQTEEAQILLNDRGEYLTIEDLWYGLHRALKNGLQLAIFNSCDGLGLAKRLNDCQIPFTIVMREAIADGVAQDFLQHFLDAFIRKGRSLPEAVRDAREKLHVFRDKLPCPSWLPVIVQQPYTNLLYWSDLVRSSEPEVLETDTQPVKTDPNQSSESDPPEQPTQPISAPSSSFGRTLLRGAAAIVALGLTILVASHVASAVLTDQGRKAYQFIPSKRDQAIREATFAFNWAIRLNPQNGKAHMFRGMLHQDEGNDEAARTAYSRSKQLRYGGGCVNLGLLEITVDRNLESAEETLTQCYYLIPNDDLKTQAALNKNLGLLFFEQGEYATAEEYLLEALRFNSDNGEASCLLAKTLKEVERNAEARQYWVDCLQDASDYYPLNRKWHREAKDELDDPESKKVPQRRHVPTHWVERRSHIS